MGLQLFNFVYNTILSKANNNTPGNSLFLPRALADMKGADGNTYLPISADNWSLNNMGGALDISNDLAASWFGAYYPQLYNLSTATANPPTVTQQMIDDAAAACAAIKAGPNLSAQTYPGVGPDLTVRQIEIAGLSNVIISGDAPQVTISDAGYNVHFKLNFNAYPSDGQNWNQPLALSGNQPGVDSDNQAHFMGLSFALSQCLGFFPRRSTTIAPVPPTLHLPPSPGHPNGFDCEASGLALLLVTNAEVVANTIITVSADGKAMQVSVKQLTLQAASGATPVYTLQNMQWETMSPTVSSNFSDYYSVWNSFYKDLLATPDAATLLTTNVNNALNSAGNLAQVEKLLNQQMVSIFDKIFGSTQVANSSVDTDTNAVDRYLFNRARAALNDAASYVYVPALVLGSASPVLEPYTVGNLTLAGPYTTSFMGQTLAVSQVVLSSLVIRGLSNLLAPANSIIFGGNQQATANLLLGTMNPGPTLNVKGQTMTVPSPPETASTPFRLNVQVGSNTPIPLSGTLLLTLQNTSGTLGVNTTLTATGDTPEQLNLIYSAITLVAANADLTITVKLDGSGGGPYSTLVSSVLNQDVVKQAILSELNQYIGGNMSQISQAATQFARNALNSLGS